jgi:predicted metal-binding protein
MDGGYGPKGKDTLRTALRTELTKTGRRRQFRIIETRCIGICPKKAVTAINADRPGTILTVPAKTTSDEVLARLISGTEG